MTLSRKLAILVLASTGIAACAIAQAGNLHRCSNKSIQGSYASTCTGTVVINQSTSMPIAIIGVVTSDGKGHFEGPATADFGGQFMPEYFSTTGPNAQPSVVNSDCTGTITYEMYTANPISQDSVDLGPLPIDFVVMDDGNQIRGMPTAPGYIVTCQLIRVHQPE